MNKIVFFLTILISMAINACAQSNNPAPKFNIAGSLGTALPPASNNYPLAGGLEFKYLGPVSQRLSIVFLTGYSFYLSNGFTTKVDNTKNLSGTYSLGSLASFLPVQVGLKFYVLSSFFIEGDAGASYFFNSNTGSKIAPVVSPGIGYTLPLGSTRYSLDLGLGFESRIQSGNNFSSATAHLALNIGL